MGGDARDPEIADPARDDAAEMRKVRSDVDRESVKRHPSFHPDPQGGDLGFPGAITDPDADATRCAWQSTLPVW